MDRSHDPKGMLTLIALILFSCFAQMVMYVLVQVILQCMLFGFCNHEFLVDIIRFVCVYLFLYFLQALHLVGQALLEEKNQLEACSVEEVTFDFSLKARSTSLCHWGGNGG